MSSDVQDIEVIYLGRRVMRNNSLADMIILNGFHPELEQLERLGSLFKAGHRRTIGGLYAAKGTVEDGRIKTLVTKSLRYIKSDAIDKDHILALEALDKQAAYEVELTKADKKARDDTVIKREIERLAQLVAKVSSYEARHAMVKTFARQLEQRVYEVRKHGK